MDADTIQYPPLLAARGISVTYAPKGGTAHVAVKSASLDVNAGEIVGLTGDSGSGKSTFALALMNLVRGPGRITSGTCTFEGQDLLALPDDALRRIRGRDIALIVQNPRAALHPMLSVGRQIVDAYRAHTPTTAKEASQRAVEMLRLLGINDPDRRFHALPAELSGGMAQRALIAMALVCGPKLLIADEPTSGLDVTIQAQVLDDLAKSAEATQSAVCLITQDLGIVANYCQRVVRMQRGETIGSTSSLEFFDAQSAVTWQLPRPVSTQS